MPAHMFRAPASVVKKVGKGISSGFVQDNGQMRGAPPASNGYYLFSEVGAGVKPLVLVGTHNDITEFLMLKKNSGIENRIQTLPDIYMNITHYRPAPRFTGLFPFHNTIVQLVKDFARFVPGSKLTDLAGAAGDIKDALNAKGYANRYSSKNSKAPANLVAITWTYLSGKGYEQIGSGTVNFSAMYAYIDNKLSGMIGI